MSDTIGALDMVKIFSNALNLPKDYYPAIGEIIFRWAQLEYQMQEIVWRALGIGNKEGRTLTVGMSASTLAAILGTLTLRWLRDKTEKQMANSIAKGVRSARDLRNQLAHGSWQFPENGDAADVYLHYMTENRQQRILPRAKKHSTTELMDTARKLERLNRKAQQLIVRLEARQKP